MKAVGRNINQFHPGDDVFGDLCEGFWGGFAEYVCARENKLTLKPTGMTYEEAAATTAHTNVIRIKTPPTTNLQK